MSKKRKQGKCNLEVFATLKDFTVLFDLDSAWNFAYQTRYIVSSNRFDSLLKINLLWFKMHPLPAEVSTGDQLRGAAYVMKNLRFFSGHSFEHFHQSRWFEQSSR